MEITNDLMASQFKLYFDECIKKYTSIENRVVLISHCGEFSQDLINSLVEGNEELMSSVGDKKILIKRVFSVLIEGLQNIRAHGDFDEKGVQMAFVLIAKEKESYKINFGNIIDSLECKNISAYIDQLNLMSMEEVKILYTKVLTEDMFSEKGGAGLGFITMKMKSSNVLHYSLEQLNETKSLFSIEVLMDRIS
jgi:hypothetical protein